MELFTFLCVIAIVLSVWIFPPGLSFAFIFFPISCGAGLLDKPVTTLKWIFELSCRPDRPMHLSEYGSWAALHVLIGSIIEVKAQGQDALLQVGC